MPQLKTVGSAGPSKTVMPRFASKPAQKCRPGDQGKVLGKDFYHSQSSPFVRPCKKKPKYVSLHYAHTLLPSTLEEGPFDRSHRNPSTPGTRGAGDTQSVRVWLSAGLWGWAWRPGQIVRAISAPCIRGARRA